jgi:phosphohistidine phosphatase SixA
VAKYAFSFDDLMTSSPVRQRFAFVLNAAALTLVFMQPPAFAQTINNATGGSRVTATIATPAPAPALVDEPYALYDGLVRELRRGGFVLFVRHAAVLPGSSDTKTIADWWKNCSATQPLSPQADIQVKAIARALTAQRVSIDAVLTSEFCRAVDTGSLLGLGTPRKIEALNDASAFASQKRSHAEQAAALRAGLAAFPAPNANRILVGHAVPADVAHPVLSVLAESETAIFRPEGGGKFHLVATLTPGQWQWIGRQAVAEAEARGTAYAPPPAPLIDPGKELKGLAIVAALRRGGYNLYMRHGTATDGSDSPNLLSTPNWWDNCDMQRRIVDAGREQARKVGTALRQLSVPIAAVKASQFCRVRDTATLLNVGPIEVTEALNHAVGQRPGFDINAARFAELAKVPPKNQNVLLVSHTHGSPRSEERVMTQIAEAELILYAPDGKGGAEPVARIPVGEWDNLIMLANAK